MIRRMVIGALVVFVPALAFGAEPKDELKAAVKKLADEGNYTWTRKIEGGFGFGANEGKTEKGGPTAFSFKMQDNSYEVVIKGDKAAAKGNAGWASADELAKEAEGGGNGFSPERMLSMMIKNFETPVAQAATLADKVSAVTKSDDVYTAELSPEAAKDLLTFRRRGANNANAPQVEVKDPKGTLKCWVKDGTLSKMELNLKGNVSFNGNERDVNRTTITEFKDVGSTKVTVPDEAKAKL
jgi:hypothetical protein